MDLNISVLENYLLVEFSNGIDYWEIVEAIGKLGSIKEYGDKNDIWVFKDGPINIMIEDFLKLEEIISSRYPKDAKRTKTAIVAETGMQSGLVDYFIKLCPSLPLKIEVFSDFKLAEKWIGDNDQ